MVCQYEYVECSFPKEKETRLQHWDVHGLDQLSIVLTMTLPVGVHVHGLVCQYIRLCKQMCGHCSRSGVVTYNVATEQSDCLSKKLHEECGNSSARSLTPVRFPRGISLENIRNAVKMKSSF